MTLNQLISTLQNLKNNKLYGNGNVEVELIPTTEKNEYGLIESIDIAEHTETGYDWFEEEEVTKTIPSIRINYTKCFD